MDICKAHPRNRSCMPFEAHTGGAPMTLPFARQVWKLCFHSRFVVLPGFINPPRELWCPKLSGEGYGLQNGPPWIGMSASKRFAFTSRTSMLNFACQFEKWSGGKGDSKQTDLTGFVSMAFRLKTIIVEVCMDRFPIVCIHRRIWAARGDRFSQKATIQLADTDRVGRWSDWVIDYINRHELELPMALADSAFEICRSNQVQGSDMRSPDAERVRSIVGPWMKRKDWSTIIRPSGISRDRRR